MRSSLLLTGISLCATVSPAAAQISPTLISSAAPGVPGNGNCDFGAIAALGGFVAFESWSNNLVNGDTNGVRDVFVRDLQTGQIELVSKSSSGTIGDNQSYAPAISADGRFVAFSSDAANLSVLDTNTTTDAFLHDRQTGTTEVVSLTISGQIPNGRSRVSGISDDARYVLFQSQATNMGVGFVPQHMALYVRDRATPRTRLAVRGVGGTDPDRPVYGARVSGSGSYATFLSAATNLVSGLGGNAVDHVYRVQIATGFVELVSRTPAGSPGDGRCRVPSIDYLGTHIAFTSEATNLVPNDTNGQTDVFYWERNAGISRLNLAPDGSQSTKSLWSWDQTGMSGDGRFTVFTSDDPALGGSNGTGGRSYLYVHDRRLQINHRVLVQQFGSATAWPRGLSHDGRYLVFGSDASNLAPGVSNLMVQTWLQDQWVPIAVHYGVRSPSLTEGPHLTVLTPPTLGQDLDFAIVNGPFQQSFGALFLGLGRTALQLGAGATVYTIPVVIEPNLFVLSAGSTWRWKAPVPPVTSLLGAPFFAQYLASVGTQIHHSKGLALRVGS